MSSDSPPAAKRRGVVTRALRRVLLGLLREEVGEVRRGLAAHQAALDAQRGELAGLGGELRPLAALADEVRRENYQLAVAIAALRSTLDERWEAGQRGRLELQQHLETILAQTGAEVAELRQAHFAVRQEVETVRDQRLPQLEVAGTQLHEALTLVQSGLEELSALRVVRLEEDARQMAGALERLQATMEELSALRVAQLEEDSATVATQLRGVQAELAVLARQLQTELERLRDGHIPRLEHALHGLQQGVSGLQEMAEELRDARLPALTAYGEARLAHLHERLEATGGLLDRLLAREPLRIATPAQVEAQLPEALRRAHLAFVDQFRGERDETLERVSEHVARLAEHEPVLDLGCGRGELLEALQRAGVAARGVDADPAMVAACRRRGLDVQQGDALEVLAAQPPGSLGAVTALHLFEHLPAGTWARIIEAAAAALRPGGVVLVECPNPESLRVGASLFWIDPTHHAPVHREAMAFVIRALGLEVVENRLLHPFPPEQRFTAPDLSPDVIPLAARLDALLLAPRDWLLVARKSLLPGE